MLSVVSTDAESMRKTEINSLEVIIQFLSNITDQFP